MNKKFYLCNLNVQSPFGMTTIFVTAVIASNRDEAINVASVQTQNVFPGGWTVVNGSAASVKTELLEEAAEQVLGWQRP